MCLEAFPVDPPFFLPFGSGMGKILPCSPFLIYLEKKKKIIVKHTKKRLPAPHMSYFAFLSLDYLFIFRKK
jgi:hypothetical protein